MSNDPDERARLDELAALELGAEIDDPALQSLVERAAEQLGLPIAAVSIVLDSAQYYIANHGLGGWSAGVGGVPIEWSICRHTVEAREPLVVNDAGEHVLVRDLPGVRVEGIRCYLGVPLITSRGHALGSLCVVGPETREFSDDDIEQLRALATEVTATLEQRRSSE